MVVEQQERISRLEGAYEQVEKRLDYMNLSIDRLWTETNSRFNNLYIMIAGSWITLMGAIIGLYIKG